MKTTVQRRKTQLTRFSIYITKWPRRGIPKTIFLDTSCEACYLYRRFTTQAGIMDKLAKYLDIDESTRLMRVNAGELGVQEFAIEKLGVQTVELKWGQGAKDIGGEVKIRTLKKPRNSGNGAM